jgi:hypothetical protein
LNRRTRYSACNDAKKFNLLKQSNKSVIGRVAMTLDIASPSWYGSAHAESVGRGEIGWITKAPRRRC